MNLQQAIEIVKKYDWCGDKVNMPKIYYQAIRVLEHEEINIIKSYYKRKGWDFMECVGYVIDEELEKELREINSLLIDKRR